MNHISDEQIRDGILDTLNAAGDQWLPLRALRAEWDGYGDVTRARLDQALIDLACQHRIRLIPEQNQKTLTDTDRAAAVWVGACYAHLIHRY